MKILSIVISLFAIPAMATDLNFQFSNPSFNGAGQSAHYLTVDEQERTRKASILEELESRANDLLRDADNTTLAKFTRNLESRIYAQLSRQLVDSLFGETASDFGTLELEGNTIEYRVEDDKVTLIITDEEGNTTEITVPLGSFTF